MSKSGDVKRIAILPARGGSKRIPQKNIKAFLGKPILAYSITSALESEIFDRVIVSTDSEEVKRVALQYGAEVPFLRSAKNSDDFSTTSDVISEVIENLKASGESYELICCIYPTAPFVSVSKLRYSCELLTKSLQATSLMPVVRYSFPIQRAVKISQDRLEMFYPEFMNTRSQDLEPAYHDAGQFYWVRESAFVQEKKLMTTHCMPFVLPENEVQDIDTEADWYLAELKFRLLNSLTN